LILLHPNSPFTAEQSTRIENYVRQGGSLLLGAENYIHDGQFDSRFNDVLKPTGMKVNDDTAFPVSADWEQSYQAISHPAALGMDDRRSLFGFERGASIHLGWFGRPIVVGSWGWSTPGSIYDNQKSIQYSEGEPLGDLVLAAEEPLWQGRIVVLGDMSCLNNERLTCSYEFAGRLFGYLAHGSSNTKAFWRQILVVAEMALLLALLASKLEAMQLAATSVVFAATALLCVMHSNSTSVLLPGVGGKDVSNIAYIDTSHLEAFSSELWNDFGIAGFSRVLMRNGFLPLRLREWTADKLDRAGLLVLIAPARPFTSEELATVRRFAEEGGIVLCMVGAEESRPIATLLADFQLNVPPSPIGTGEDIREPEPFGAFIQTYGDSKDASGTVVLYAAWPMEIEKGAATTYLYWADSTHDAPVIAGVPVGKGKVIVIADTNFAVNLNLKTSGNESSENAKFWDWLLPLITGREPLRAPAEPIRELGPMKVDDVIQEQGPQ
jgi:hypothetical protein